MNVTRKAILIVLSILVLDQALKIIIKTQMFLYQQIPFLGQWGILNFVENNGMAFGMALPGPWGKILLTSFRLIAIVAIIYYMRHLIREKAHQGLIMTLAMVLAGASGNLIDSIFYGLIFNESTPIQIATMFPEGGGYAPLFMGKVVDMFYFPIIRTENFTFFRPVFNIADSSITVAVAIMLIRQKVFFAELVKKEEGEKAEGKVGEKPSSQD